MSEEVPVTAAPPTGDPRALASYEVVPRHEVIHLVSDDELDSLQEAHQSNDLALFCFTAGLGAAFLLTLLVSPVPPLQTVLLAALVFVCGLLSVKFLLDHRGKRSAANRLVAKIRRRAR